MTGIACDVYYAEPCEHSLPPPPTPVGEIAYQNLIDLTTLTSPGYSTRQQVQVAAPSIVVTRHLHRFAVGIDLINKVDSRVKR